MNYADLPPGNVNPQHLHTFFQLDLILKGEVEYGTEDGTSRLLKRGNAIIVPPLMKHWTFCKSGYRHISLKFFLSSQFSKLIGWRSVAFKPSSANTQALEGACKQYVENAEHRTERIVAASTLVLLDSLFQLPSTIALPLPDDEFRRLVLPVLQPVDENPTSDWTVADMAARCNLSVDYFSKRFHNTFHYTPHEYLMQARMRWAASRLLIMPPVPIKVISAELGYSSVQTFTRAFKNAIGLSPAQFRDEPHLSGVLTSYR